MEITKVRIAAIGMIVSGAASLCSCGGSDQQQGRQMPTPEISVMTIEPTRSELQDVYPAQIKGKTDIDIRPQVSGFITKVHVDEGQHVQKGQVLFTLDQVQYQAAVDQAQAAVNSAKVAVDNAQITADNQKRLFDKGIISESQYLTAANQLSMAKAQLSQANAALTNAKKNMSYTVVTAPSSGVVGSIPNREGSLASPSSAQALTTISDNSQVYAYFSFNEKDLLKLTENGKYSLDAKISAMPPVRLRLSNGELYAFEGKVATVNGVLDNSTGAATVRALFNNDNGMLRSGSTGQIEIPVVTDNALVVPQKAVFELQDLKYVYVINDSNKAVSTPVKVLDNSDGHNYVITSGLEPGQVIAIEGVGTVVKEGTVIKPKNNEAVEHPATPEE